MGSRSAFVFGGAGFAREVDWLNEDLCQARSPEALTIEAFVVSDDDPGIGTDLNGRPVVGESVWIEAHRASSVACVVAVGHPKIRQKIAGRLLSSLMDVVFPSLIHPNVQFDRREGKVKVGEGSIVCAGSVLTTDIVVGRFVHINLDCTVGHDAIIGDFVTLSPGVHVSGGVTFESLVFVGTGANFLEGVSVANGAVIGAGATLTRSAVHPGTYVGVPARKIR